MKGQERPIQSSVCFTCLVLLAIFLTSCSTTPKVDWNTRVGNFTYDQAVTEMGPPDKIAPLSDGTKVADWLLYRGWSQGYVSTIGPAPYSPYLYGGPALYYSGTPSPDRYLRLTFGPDGKLVNWRKVYR